jgi:hypothetical protein
LRLAGPKPIFPFRSAEITTPRGEDYQPGEHLRQDAPEGETGRF